ncbi:MAG: alkaline phosphatase family protein [Phycisphaerales bacterium]|nr:alkaline phosphatase family protein [Phycisphaerales bacterium]
MPTLITCLAAALLPAMPQAPARPTEPAPKVLLIGLDGLRPDALLLADAPNLHELIRNGCFTDQSHTGAPTVSGPGWSSVLCGVWHNKHGVKDNTFRGANYTQYPHMFTRIKEVRPELKVGTWSTWQEIDMYLTPTCTDIHVFFNYKEKGDERNCEQACADIAAKPVDVAFYYVSDIDETGHNSGFHPGIPEYMAAIKLADQQVGKVLAAVRSRPTFKDENWLYIVTPDHSGTIDGNHGRDEEAHRRIFYIVSGEAAARGTIRDTVNQVDAVATLLAHMGITPKPEWNLDGRVRGLKSRKQYNTNLIDNGDAEAITPASAQDQNLGIPGWVDLAGMTAIGYDALGGFPTHASPGPKDRGKAFFAGGAVDSVMAQTIDLADFAVDIDAGMVRFDLSAWLGGFADQRDMAVVDVRFTDENGGTLGAAALTPVTTQDRLAAFGGSGDRATGFVERKTAGAVPPRARIAEVRVQSLAGQGSADGYSDNISLVLHKGK